MKFARILKHLEFNLIFSRVGLVWARPYPCPNEARSKSKNPSRRAPPTTTPSAVFASNFVARVRSDGRRRRRRRPLSIAPLRPRIGESSLVRRLRLPPSLRQVRWRLRLLLPILRLRRLPCAPPSLRSFPSIRPSPPPTIRTPQAHPSAIPAFSSASTPSRSPPCGRHLHARVWSACRNSGIVAPSRDAAAATSTPASGAPPPTPVPPLCTGATPRTEAAPNSGASTADQRLRHGRGKPAVPPPPRMRPDPPSPAPPPRHGSRLPLLRSVFLVRPVPN